MSIETIEQDFPSEGVTENPADGAKALTVTGFSLHFCSTMAITWPSS